MSNRDANGCALALVIPVIIVGALLIFGAVWEWVASW